MASTEDQRDVILLREKGQPGEPQVSDLSTGSVTKAIPDDLRTAVDALPRQQHWRFVTLHSEGGGPSAAGRRHRLGRPGPAPGPYELYFVFSLQRETATVDLVRRTFLLGGVVLVLLVGAVAYVVTRQVVSPVRRAVVVAERLSAGRLQERMTSKGEDDLARLGASFNGMAANLQDQIRRLEELSRVQQRFVSDVSHELRTPLTTIRMAGEVLHDARHDFTPSVARSAELLQTQLDRFESLLADLLEISRFDAGAAALDLEPVDLRDVVARAVEASQPLADRRGSRVIVEGADPVRRDHRPAPGRADPGQPGRQRDRARRGPAGHRPARLLRATPWRSRSRTAASGCARARASWCSTGSGGPTPRGPGPAAAPGSAWPSRWRTPACTAAGCRPGASPGVGSVFRLTLPREAGTVADRLAPAARARPAERATSARRTSGSGPPTCRGRPGRR